EGVREGGYQLLVGCNDYSLEREEELVRTFLARGADAIVLTGHLHTPRTTQLLRKDRVPVVEMWSVGEQPIGTSIGIDDFDAALEATRHLISKGRRRIGYIGGKTEGNDRAQARIMGFRMALKEAGITVDERLELMGTFEFDTGASAMYKLIQIEPELDAVFAASDIIATGALLRCLQEEIDVPGRVAICGFDDARIAQMIRPALTTVKFSRREIGRQVAQMLMKQLQGETPEEKVIRIRHSLIVRETT
ncbi:substrate-binding domain-containing protein, partial [Halomonas elongata]|uniref:substrate-binding domain-containing protein n=1 Tax=Halomonas elongata TaxID=2746 RepID=UPI00255AADD3